MATLQAPATHFDLYHDAWGRLVLVDRSGVQYVDVEPVRSFPISDPEHWISICDASGRELLVIEDLTMLDSDTRQVLEQDLARREFVPHLQRVVSIAMDQEPIEWHVETDRGMTRFLVHSGEDVRRLGPHRALIVDNQGIRYLVEDTRELDPVSRRLIERYLG